MRAASLLICCAPSPTADSQTLEDWLAGVAAGLGSGGAVLFRAQEADPGDSGPEHGSSPEHVLFLAILEHGALDASRVAELVGEMRLLGLNPTVFHPGPLPMVHQGLANVF